MRKIKIIAFIASLAMCIALLGVGYSTWYMSSISAEPRQGSVESYGVITSDDYYTLETTVGFHSYVNRYDFEYKKNIGHFIDFATVNSDTSGTPTNETTLTLEYAAVEGSEAPSSLTAKVMFGDASNSATFFGVVDVTNVAVTNGTLNTPVESAESNGVITIDVGGLTKGKTVTIVITLESVDVFDDSFMKDKQFSISTTVQK